MLQLERPRPSKLHWSQNRDAILKILRIKIFFHPILYYLSAFRLCLKVDVACLNSPACATAFHKFMHLLSLAFCRLCRPLFFAVNIWSLIQQF